MDYFDSNQYTRLMNIQTIGQLIAGRRRELGLTLSQLAAKAGIGRSTLAALEGGKLPELGIARISRLCAAVDLVVDVRPLLLEAPILQHRHLTDVAARELSKAAIDDVITRGDIAAWRKLVQAMDADVTGRTTRRVHDVCKALASGDVKARAFANLLPKLERSAAGVGLK
jgi:transcriptional regulator with XRE-family HTH domain